MMRNETIFGAALIGSVAGLLVTAALHPTGLQMLSSAEGLHRYAVVGIAVHALALASTGLSVFGLAGLSRRLGVGRLDVTAALTAFAMAVIGVICAATVSGLVAPALARAMFAADDATRPLVRQLLVYNGLFNQAFAKLHVVASSIALLLWSVAMGRTEFSRVLAWVGGTIAVVTVAALLTGRLHLDVHGFGLVVLSQGAWMVWAGVILIRSKSG